jgi:hypothetical protein
MKNTPYTAAWTNGVPEDEHVISETYRRSLDWI